MTKIWLHGLAAAAISGTSGGVLMGLAAAGIDPQHFNLHAGMHQMAAMSGAGAIIGALIGVAAFFQKSPLPTQSN